MDNWLLIIMVLIIFISYKNSNDFMINKIIKKKRGIKMPKNLINEVLGKVCYITLFNETVMGTVEEVEDNWIKVKEKNNVRLINGDMIRDIKIMPDKYQK